MEIIPDLSFCVTAGSSPEILRLVLQSFYDTADHISFEIFVVDRSGDSKLAAMVARLFPEVHLFESDGAEGLAVGQNNVLRLTKGRYVALWAGDLLCRPDSLTKMLLFLDDNPEVGLIGPRIIGADHAVESVPETFPALGRLAAQFIGRNGEEAGKLLAGANPEVDWMPGDCLVLRREALDETGSLDEGYVSGRFDMDYCWRAKKAGWHTHYLPGALVERLPEEVTVAGSLKCSTKEESTGPETSLAVTCNGRDLLRFFWKKWLGNIVAL